MERVYYDENFGFYNIESEDDIAFYRQVQEESTEKTCEGCGRIVRLRPDYGFCNSCADAREQGREY